MTPPKQASPVKTRTPSPTNDTGAAGLASEDQETQTISSEIEPDESVSDEGYAESTSTSYVSSIASDVRRGIEENGRLYAAYGKHKPWVPVDDAEMDRNDFQHCKFTLLLNNELHLAPIKPDPHKILDLGTGSGIWAIDMGDKHPSAEIIGVDTAAVQPNMLPPNVQFEIDDVESDWLYGESLFDFIHGRELILSIRNWPRLVQQSFRALKPGGYFELSGSLPVISSDDGTHIPNSAFEEMAQVYFDMGDRIGASGKAPLSWKTQLEEAGFENVVEKVLKIPTNPWPKDPRMKKIGAFELSHFRDGISNIFARGYTQILGGDPLYFEILMARAKAEVSNRRMHTYLHFYVVYGQRPLEAQV